MNFPFRLRWLVTCLALTLPVRAHRLDEYLQATLVTIEPDSVTLQIDLTPGVAVAAQVLALIDLDRDGVICKSEAASYSEALKRDLVVRLDEKPVELNIVSARFPEKAELESGQGIIQMVFSAASVTFPGGNHRLTLENRHLVSQSVYLLNALQPRTHALEITRQTRNENQSEGQIEFNYHSPATFSRTMTAVILVAGFFIAWFIASRIEDRAPSVVKN